MLVPHRRHDAELGDRRLAPDEPDEALILVGLEPMLSNELGSDVRRRGIHCAQTFISESWMTSISPAARTHLSFVRSASHLLSSHAASNRLSNIGRQSVEPWSGSIMFSGCGIMPMTLPRSFMMPAMSLTAPLGLVPPA